MTASIGEFDDSRAKRNAMVLAVAQALYSSGSVDTGGNGGAGRHPAGTFERVGHAAGVGLCDRHHALDHTGSADHGPHRAQSGLHDRSGDGRRSRTLLALCHLHGELRPVHPLDARARRIPGVEWLFPLRRSRYRKPRVQAEGDILGVDRRDRGGNFRHDDRDANDRPPGAGDFRRLLSRHHGTCAPHDCRAELSRPSEGFESSCRREPPIGRNPAAAAAHRCHSLRNDGHGCHESRDDGNADRHDRLRLHHR